MRGFLRALDLEKSFDQVICIAIIAAIAIVTYFVWTRTAI